MCRHSHPPPFLTCSSTESMVITSDKVSGLACCLPDFTVEEFTKRMDDQDWRFICASDNCVVYVLFEGAKGFIPATVRARTDDRPFLRSDASTPHSRPAPPAPPAPPIPARNSATPNSSMQSQSNLLESILQPDCHPRVLEGSVSNTTPSISRARSSQGLA
jgi:hypothetical protein